MDTIISAILTLACLIGADSCYLNKDVISQKVEELIDRPINK